MIIVTATVVILVTASSAVTVPRNTHSSCSPCQLHLGQACPWWGAWALRPADDPTVPCGLKSSMQCQSRRANQKALELTSCHLLLYHVGLNITLGTETPINPLAGEKRLPSGQLCLHGHWWVWPVRKGLNTWRCRACFSDCLGGNNGFEAWKKNALLFCPLMYRPKKKTCLSQPAALPEHLWASWYFFCNLFCFVSSQPLCGSGKVNGYYWSAIKLPNIMQIHYFRFWIQRLNFQVLRNWRRQNMIKHIYECL